MIVVVLAFFVLCIVCAVKESKVTGMFKTFRVYGRVSAYMGMFCPLGLIMFVVGFFVPEFSDQKWMMLILGLVGSLFYIVAYMKCPPFLKKKVIPCMILSGFGLCVKLAFFFIGAVWKLTGPQEMVDGDGNSIYVISGEVYDGGGNHLGTMTSDGNSYIPVQ